MRYILHIFFGMLLISLISSCASPKDVLYFQDLQVDTSLHNVVNYEIEFEAGDMIYITVSGADLMAVQPFNLPVINLNPADGKASGQVMMQSYLVHKDGTIDFPLLGKIQVAGKTKLHLREHLLIRLKEYVNDPIVNISMANFRVTVLGDVAKPGTFSILNDKITLLEAIGMAGDLQITGKRDNIMVIREESGDKKIFRVDLREGNILNSPVYYLKQNDVVYVEPNKAKVNSSSYSANSGIIISAATLLVTIFSIILNIILK